MESPTRKRRKSSTTTPSRPTLRRRAYSTMVFNNTTGHVQHSIAATSAAAKASPCEFDQEDGLAAREDDEDVGSDDAQSSGNNETILIDALDLRLPLLHSINEMQALLEDSLSAAMRKLERLLIAQSAESIQSPSTRTHTHHHSRTPLHYLSSDTEDETAIDSDCETVASPTLRPISPPLPHFGDNDEDEDEDGDASTITLSPPPAHVVRGEESRDGLRDIHLAKEDAETLQAFIQEAYNLLGSIRSDVQSLLPSLPDPSAAAESFRARFPTASAAVSTMLTTAAEHHPRVALDKLSQSYQRANELLQHMSLCSSSLSIATLPEMLPALPESVASSIAAARATWAESSVAVAATGVKRHLSMPLYSAMAPSPSLSSPTSTEATSEDSTAPSLTVHSNGSSYARLPTPPLSAIRAFFAQESAKLSARLPQPRRPRAPTLPSFDQWADNLSHALHDAKDYMQDESERLKEYVVDEADRLFKNALQFGADRLLHYHELPHAWRNNKYILTGYRFIPADRPGRLLLSAVQWHNETVNIYTHFIPALYIIYYIAFVFPTTSLGDPGQNAFLDRAINLTFLFASLACLMLSAAWHLAAGCGTLAVFHSCATLDYLGISSLISTSILTLTHQGFRCKHREGFYYNIAISAIGLLGLYLPWRPWFNRPDKKSARIAFFLAMSAAGTAPLFHFASLFGLHDTWKFYSPVLYSLIAYTLGLLFYAFDFPERVRPGGLCDTLFHSHQFWHCAIVAAIALHWSALTTMSEQGLVAQACAAASSSSSSMLGQQGPSLLLERMGEALKGHIQGEL